MFEEGRLFIEAETGRDAEGLPTGGAGRFTAGLPDDCPGIGRIPELLAGLPAGGFGTGRLGMGRLADEPAAGLFPVGPIAGAFDVGRLTDDPCVNA